MDDLRQPKTKMQMRSGPLWRADPASLTARTTETGTAAGPTLVYLYAGCLPEQARSLNLESTETDVLLLGDALAPALEAVDLPLDEVELILKGVELDVATEVGLVDALEVFEREDLVVVDRKPGTILVALAPEA